MYECMCRSRNECSGANKKKVKVMKVAEQTKKQKSFSKVKQTTTVFFIRKEKIWNRLEQDKKKEGENKLKSYKKKI